MAATVKKNIWFHSSDSGGTPDRVRGLIAASQGILIPGAPMYLSQSGTWKVSDTSDGTGDTIHGFFAGREDREATWPLTAELSANAAILVDKVSVQHKYLVFVENNDSDSAAAQTIVGNEYGIRVATGAGKVGYVTVDINNSNDTVTVLDVMSNLTPLKYTTSTSPGLALVRFLSSVIEAERA
jgi:hypothetical protein